MLKPIEHFAIQEASPACEDGIASYTVRAFFQHLCGELDARMMQEIRKTLVEQGYTDLYVIDDDFILEAIKREVERRENKPLTVDELKQRNSKPIWVHRFEEPDVYDHRHSCWCIVDTTYDIVEDIDGGSYHFDNYNITWLAYNHEPTHS